MTLKQAACLDEHLSHEMAQSARRRDGADILSDANWITIPRLQIAVITVVLVGYFVIGVARDLALPALDATWSALMGIGSLTYLGFKLPEKKTNSD